jgi:hypothetical protein
VTALTAAQALRDIMQGDIPVSNPWLRSWNTLPSPDELVLVALYRADGNLHGYVLARWDEAEGEWQSDEGDYCWPRIAGPGRSAGLLWSYFGAAPEIAADIPGAKLGKVA